MQEQLKTMVLILVTGCALVYVAYLILKRRAHTNMQQEFTELRNDLITGDLSDEEAESEICMFDNVWQRPDLTAELRALVVNFKEELGI